MSEERPIFARWRFPFAEIEGKKIMIVELFEAGHWRFRHGMSVYPLPHDLMDGGATWEQRYRLRINGRWFGPRKLSFFTMVQVAQIVERILATGNCNDRAVIELDHYHPGTNQPAVSDCRERRKRSVNA